MPVDRKRLSEELREMKRLIREDPEVLAQFDKDGNGVIDGDEWEEVRLLVIARLEREADEAEAAKDAVKEAAAAGVAVAATPPPLPSVAEEIARSDLQTGAPEATSFEALTEFVLRQDGGLVGQLLEGAARRKYSVLSRSGEKVLGIEQVQNEMLQHQQRSGMFTHMPDLDFVATDPTTLSRTNLRRSEFGGLPARTRMGVLDSKKREIAFCEYRAGLLGGTFRVNSVLEALGLEVKKRVWKPFTYDVTDEVGDVVGEVSRGWSGLGGLLSGGNMTHVEVQGEVGPELRWGLVAMALLSDLIAEDARKRR